MQQTLHIFRKDVKRLWPFGLVVMALFAALAYAVNGQEEAYRNYDLRNPADAILMVLIITVWVVSALVIQQEPVPGDRQFWLTRPYSRRSLLAAKGLFLVAFVFAPMLAADVAMLASVGFSPGDHVVSLLWKQVMAAVLWVVPAVCLASVTRSISTYLLASMGGVVIANIASRGITHTVSWNGLAWTIMAAILVVVLAAAPAVLSLQYLRRLTTPAATILGAAFAATAASVSLPWDPAFALQTRLSPRAIKPGEVRVELDAGRGRYVAEPWEPAERGHLSIPVRMEHAEGESVECERLTVSIPAVSDWKPLDEWRYPTRLNWVENEKQYRLDLTVRPDLLAGGGQRPLDMHVSLYLTVFANPREERMPVSAGRAEIAGIGDCFVAGAGRTGAHLLRLGCQTAFRGPDRTMVRLEHRSSGAKSPRGLLGVPANFAPFPHDRVVIPVSIAQGGFASGSFDASLLADSDVVFEKWERAGHLKKDLVLQAIRLADFAVPAR